MMKAATLTTSGVYTGRPRPAAQRRIAIKAIAPPLPQPHSGQTGGSITTGKNLGLGKRSLVVEVEPPQPASNGVPARGPAYRPALYPGFAAPTGKTLYDNFTEAVGRFPDRECLGRRVGSAYQFMTYRQAGQLAADIASAMVHVGVPPHGRASIFGANSVEWMAVMQACNRQTVYCVPLYDALGDHTVDYIIEHSETSIVFVSTAKLPVLAKALPKVLPQVKTVVYWGALDAKSKPALEEIRSTGVPVYSFSEFEQLGKEHPAQPVPPKPEDICTIMYTSGTTGTPKGVLMTHQAVASEAEALRVWFDKNNLTLSTKDVYLSFLPLAHIYGRAMEEAFLKNGVSIAYWSGDAKLLSADIKASQPTIFCSVPRVFERFESTAMDKLKREGPTKRRLFGWAFNAKLAALKAGRPWSQMASALLDDSFFKSMSQQMLGGRMKLISSGGAPLASHIEDFMRVCSCAPFVQGYGLTETCAASFVSYWSVPDQMRTVGPPMPVVTMRLEAVPEMGYDPLGDPPRGEVLVKGDAVTRGYYKNEEETRKAIDPEGWFHTGDVGELTPSGALRIIDRKKNMFKLSQGEYIAVEKIEGVLEESSFVNQIWVHGSHFESCLVAVVVPSKGKLTAWAYEQGIEAERAEDLCSDDQVRAMLLQDIQETGRRGGLKPFELPKAVLVEPEPFSIDNDLMTPTFELRRRQLLERYRPQIEAMYRAMKTKGGR